MSAKKWSKEVTEHSDALDLKAHVLESHDPKTIAKSLKNRRKKVTAANRRHIVLPCPC